MAKRTKVYLLSCLLFMIAQPACSQYEQGKHYLEAPFSQPLETGDKVEVREFFWYGCSHCYALEPYLEKWLKNKPANAQFIRTPGVSSNWLGHAQAYYAFEAMGIIDDIHRPFFNVVHSGAKPKSYYTNEQTIGEFVKQQGFNRTKFQEAFRSFGVRLQLNKAEQLNRNYLIDSVPKIIVDGKYITSPTLAGSDQEVIRVINFLVNKAYAERQKKGKK